MLRRICLDYNLSRFFSPSCTSCGLRKKLKGSLCPMKIIDMQRHVCRKYTDQRHIGKVVSFYNHLGTDQNIRFLICKGLKNFLKGILTSSGIKIHSQNPGLRELFLNQFFYSLCSCLKSTDIFRATGWTNLRHWFLIATIVTAQDIPAVQTQ